MLLHSGTAEEKVAALRAFFDGFGVAAPLAYVGFVILEVVIAPIPGTMLYAPGGVIFGGFWGGLLSLTGNVIGAGIACQLMRVFIGKRAEEYLERSALARYEERITRHGAWVVFLLRVNPLTSSDLVSYAAGLTHLPVWKLMLGTLAGMAPLCFAQSYLADGLLTCVSTVDLSARGRLCGLWIGRDLGGDQSAEAIADFFPGTVTGVGERRRRNVQPSIVDDWLTFHTDT